MRLLGRPWPRAADGDRRLVTWIAATPTLAPGSRQFLEGRYQIASVHLAMPGPLPVREAGRDAKNHTLQDGSERNASVLE
jgi:hypothetical protein